MEKREAEARCRLATITDCVEYWRKLCYEAADKYTREDTTDAHVRIVENLQATIQAEAEEISRKVEEIVRRDAADWKATYEAEE